MFHDVNLKMSQINIFVHFYMMCSYFSYFLILMMLKPSKSYSRIFTVSKTSTPQRFAIFSHLLLNEKLLSANIFSGTEKETANVTKKGH